MRRGPSLLLGLLLVSVSLIVWLVRRPGSAATVTIRDRRFVVEVADDPPERFLGLRGRPALSADHGMVFLFPNLEPQVFTMDGVLIALDLLWITGGRVVGITENALPAAPGANSRYPSPQPVDAVLEVVAGTVPAAGFKIGDPVALEPP